MSTHDQSLQNPFPGLRPFEPDEDYLFFGREEQTIELLSRLAENRFVAVVGTSGSGKSSLVRCGLLSELLGGKLRQAGAAWEIAVTHPGGNPLALLTESLLEADLYDAQADHARENVLATLSRSHFGLVEAVKQSEIGDDTNFLLVVDQFEEIFRFHEAGQAQKEVANEFVSLLLEAVTQSTVPIYVVLTMRSDFIGECGQFEGLAEMVNRGEFLIPRLNREQYKRVIEGPIKVAGGEITPRLLQRLLNDLGQQADQLPCLQHALMRTWNVWSENGAEDALDLDDYQQVGKMTQALSLHADEVYESLASDRERELCRGLFQALTVQESENRGIRRPQRLDRLCEILEVGADELLPVIDAYRESGVTFLMPPADVELTDRTIIDISHESLMRVWTRLRFWVEEEAQAAGIYRRLSESATLHQQGEAGLYRDPELGIALAWKQEKRPNRAWAERYRAGFDSAMSFLAQSERAAEAEAEAREAARQRELAQAKQLADVQRRSARRLRVMVCGLAVVALMAVVATINAMQARSVADNAKLAALASEEQALESADRAQREAERALEQEAAARRAEESATAARGEAEAATDAFEQQLYLSDMTLANHSYDEGNVGRVTKMLLDHVPSADAPEDPRGFEWFHLWAGAHRVSKTFQPDRGSGGQIGRIRFTVPVLALDVSPDGTRGAASYRDGIAVFDPHTQETLDVLDAGGLARRNAFITIGFSADGNQLAAVTEEGDLQVWDAKTYAARMRQSTSTTFRGVTFSAAEPLLASGGSDGQLYLWNTTSWEPLESQASVGLPIECLSFSPDGTWIAIGTAAATSDSDPFKTGVSLLAVWDVANQEMMASRQETTGAINALAWSPDGETLVTAGTDDTLRIWNPDLTARKSIDTRGPVRTIDFAGDGSLLAVGMTRDNSMQILATDTWEQITELKGQSRAVSAISFIGDSQTLVAGSDNGQLEIWDVTNALQEPAETVRDETLQNLLRQHQRAWIGGDGSTIFCWSSGAPIVRFDLSARRTLPDWNDGHPYSLVALSEGGQFLAAVTEQRELFAWNLADETLLFEGEVHEQGQLIGLTISRDGSRVAWLTGNHEELDGSGDLDSGVIDIQSGQSIVFRYDTWGGFGQHLSPDGSRLAGRQTLNVRLFDIEDLSGSFSGYAPDFTPMEDPNIPHTIVFSPDGSISASLAAPMIGGRIANSAAAIALHNREGELLHSLAGHTGRVNCGTFSADGRRFVSGGEDGTIRIWDVANGNLLLTLRGHNGPVHALAFDPQRNSLTSLSRADGRVRIWHAPTARELESDVTYWTELADYLVAANDPAGARLAYAEAAKRSPTPLEYHRLRGDLGVAMGLTASVVDDYVNVIAWGGANAELVDLTSELAKIEPLVANTEEQLLTWRYTFDVPDPQWNQPSFDASAWSLGRSPFGNERGDRTAWNTQEIWLRVEFEIEQIPSSLQMRAWNDDSAEFYVNGVLAAARDYTGRRYSRFDLSPEAVEALQVGQNVLAIHCLDTGGATRRIDAGMYRQQGHLAWVKDLDRFLEQHPDSVYLLQARMKAYEQASEKELTRADARRLVTILEPDVKAEMLIPGATASDKVGIFARATLHAESSDAVDWHLLAPTEMRSELGTTLSMLPDESILASGENPIAEVYTIVGQPAVDQIGAIRLEAMTHPSLPDEGPGRATPKSIGVFAMIRWLIESVPADPSGEQTRILPIEAWADHTKDPDDNVLGGHWNITYGAGEDHLALFRVKPPVPLTEGNLLRFKMWFNRDEDWPGQNLGRFRISLAREPEAYDRERLLHSVQLADSGWNELASAYYLVGNQQALDELLEARPEGAAGLAGLFAQQGFWQLALESYNDAIDADRPDTELLIARSRVHDQLGNAELAAADRQRAVELTFDTQSMFDKLRQEQDWPSAAAFGWRRVEEDPIDSDVWLELAPTLLLAGDREGYARLCQHMLAQDSVRTIPRESGRVTKACLLAPNAVDVDEIPVEVFIQTLDQGEGTSSWRIWAWAARGLLAHRQGNAEEALEHLEAALAEDEPSDVQLMLIHAVRTLALIELDRHIEAESALTTATEVLEQHAAENPTQAIHDRHMPHVLLEEARQLLAERQRRFKQWAANEQWKPIAEELLANMESMVPSRHANEPRSKWLQEIILRGDGVFDAMIELQPDNTLLYLARARDLALREQWDDAANTYAKAVVATPKSEEYFEYAACLLMAGRESEYRQVVSDLAELTEQSEVAFDQFAAARAAMLLPESPIDTGRVVQWARHAAEADPQPWQQHVLGIALFRDGQLEKATELLERVRNNYDWGKDLKDIGLCLIHLELGELDVARRYRGQVQGWLDRTAELRAAGGGRNEPTNWVELQVLLREADAQLNPQL